MFFWPPTWQTRRTHAYKPIYEKLVFLWFNSQLLNFSYFLLGKMDKSLKCLRKDCFLHLFIGFMAYFRSLLKSKPSISATMSSMVPPGTQPLLYHLPLSLGQRGLFLRLCKSSASSENDFQVPPTHLPTNLNPH